MMVAKGKGDTPQIPGVRALSDADLVSLYRSLEAEWVKRIEQSNTVCGKISPHRESTTDLALAAFYLHKGLPLVNAAKRRDGKGGSYQQVEFTFACPADVAAKLRLAWMNSEIQHYDSAMRHLKKIFSKVRSDAE